MNDTAGQWMEPLLLGSPLKPGFIQALPPHGTQDLIFFFLIHLMCQFSAETKEAELCVSD